MKTFVLYIAIVIIAMFVASCKNNSTSPNTTTGQSITISDFDCDTTGGRAGLFNFYSLTTNSKVSRSDSASTKWDIAFNSTKIIFNCGISGPGQGGCIVMRDTSFTGVIEAPATGYAIDTSLTQLALKTGSGNGWYSYDFVNNVIVAKPGVVLVIRTADGRYAKLAIISYYKGAPGNPTGTDLPRYYNFKFFFQSDATSRKLTS